MPNKALSLDIHIDDVLNSSRSMILSNHSAEICIVSFILTDKACDYYLSPSRSLCDSKTG